MNRIHLKSALLFFFLTQFEALGAQPFHAQWDWFGVSQEAIGWEGWAGVGLTIFFVGLGILLLYHRRDQPQKNFFLYALTRPVVWTLLLSVGVFAGVNFWVSEPDLLNPREATRVGSALNNAQLQYEGALGSLMEHPSHSILHFDFIDAYYRLTPSDLDYYQAENKLIRPEDLYFSDQFFEDTLHDARELGTAYKDLLDLREETAQIHLNSVLQPNQPLVHYVSGKLAFQKGDMATARKEAWAELESYETFSRVVPLLEEIHLVSLEPDSLLNMIRNPSFRPHLSPTLFRELALSQKAPYPYLLALAETFRQHFSLIGLISAVLGLAVWLLFLRKMDLFRAEPWLWALLAVALGGLSTLFGLVFYDITSLMGMKINGDFWHDFGYCWAGIGAIEEFVKILPFLVLLRYTQLIKDPVDYILYPSLIALGFAVTENILYFERGSLSLYHGRTLICVISHMFDTSLIGFGLMMAKFKFKIPHRIVLLPAFALGSLSHGFYDFWLLSPAAQNIRALATLYFILSTSVFANLFNNALNQSPRFKHHLQIPPAKMAAWLFSGLVGTLVVEYFLFAWSFGPNLANAELGESAASGSYLLFFLLVNLSNIDLVKGEWAWPKWIPYPNKTWKNRTLGHKLTLSPEVSPNASLPFSNQILGIVTERIPAEKGKIAFRFLLETPLLLDQREVPELILRPIHPHLPFGPGTDALADAFVPPLSDPQSIEESFLGTFSVG